MLQRAICVMCSYQFPLCDSISCFILSYQQIFFCEIFFISGQCLLQIVVASNTSNPLRSLPPSKVQALLFNPQKILIQLYNVDLWSITHGPRKHGPKYFSSSLQLFFYNTKGLGSHYIGFHSHSHKQEKGIFWILMYKFTEKYTNTHLLPHISKY